MALAGGCFWCVEAVYRQLDGVLEVVNGYAGGAAAQADCYGDEQERAVAEAYIRQLEAAKVFGAPIATELTKLDRFYPAEAYHQDYAANHPDQPYVRLVAAPKVAKLRKHFAEKLKAAVR
ncbi:MAG TPA: peptide-methionine (S)-S-oxide reductase [Candidatus Limnocylindria bacterium]|nr:peptide-methionine (S)-S-oxide reductase [Candidatus Limnocylindria bacterium]